MNALLDAESNLWYTNLDAEQDHDFSGYGCHAGGSPCRIRRAIVHPRQRSNSKGLSAALLSQHDVLCHVAKEYSSLVAAVRKEWFRIGGKDDLRADGVCSSASIIGRSVASQN